jgi:hypothetical protein
MNTLFVTRFELVEVGDRLRVRRLTPGATGVRIRARGAYPLEPPAADLTEAEWNSWMLETGVTWKCGFRDPLAAPAVQEVPADRVDW